MAAAGGAAMRVRRAQLARGGAALKFDGSHPSKLPCEKWTVLYGTV
tara:strand:+ start:142 stop:279 length:138 start_codon:yes stop_codon:yes gene_type:complete